MSKECVKLYLKDMYAIKHALEKSVKERQGHLNGNGYTEEGRKQAEKDQRHEVALIERIKEKIKDFKEKNRIK